MKPPRPRAHKLTVQLEDTLRPPPAERVQARDPLDDMIDRLEDATRERPSQVEVHVHPAPRSRTGPPSKAAQAGKVASVVAAIAAIVAAVHELIRLLNQ